MPEVIFLQEQINDLQIKTAATDKMILNAVERIGANAQSLKAVHARFDNVAVKSDIQEMLDHSRDKLVADVAKKVAMTILTLGLGALVSWMSGVFHTTPS